MLKLLVLTLVVLTTLTVNPYLIPQVISSSESSSLSSEDRGDNNENNGSGSEDESPQDDSGGSDSSSPEDNEGDNNGIGQTDEQEPTGDDGGNGVDNIPPSSTERGGNPLEGLNLRNLEKEKADCEKYLKSLGGSDGTNVGDTIENPFETKEEYCKRILGGAGIDVRDIDNADDDLTGQSIVNCAPDTGITIKTEGMPSETMRREMQEPQPQPSPSPPPQQPSPQGGC